MIYMCNISFAGAFIICFLPYFTLFMVVAYCGNDQCVNPTVFTITIWFGYFNSTLNPILYPLCNANFKTAFKRMLTTSWWLSAVALCRADCPSSSTAFICLLNLLNSETTTAIPSQKWSWCIQKDVSELMNSTNAHVSTIDYTVCPMQIA